MNDKEEFEFSSRLATDEAARYLNRIADGLKSQLLKLQGKGQIITLNPQESVKLEMKAEQKEGKGKVKIEISWKERYHTSDDKLEVTVGTSPGSDVTSVSKGKSKEQVEEQS